LKYYRDLKNVVDTSYEEGRKEDRREGTKQVIEIVRLYKSGKSVQEMANEVAIEETHIRQLLEDMGLL